MPISNRPATIAIAIACAAALTLAACGGGDEEESSGPPDFETVESCLEDQGMDVTVSTNANVKGFDESGPVNVLNVSAASTDTATLTFWSTEENAQDSVNALKSLGPGEAETHGTIALQYGYTDGEAYPAAVECLS